MAAATDALRARRPGYFSAGTTLTVADLTPVVLAKKDGHKTLMC